MKKYFGLDHRLLENFSWPLLLSMLGLCACGLLNLYSASAAANFVEEWSWFTRQSIYVAIAVTGLVALLFIDYQHLKKLIWPVYIFSILCLVVTYFKGVTVNNATRWLDLGLFRFQPSEMVMVVVGVARAAWFAKRDLSIGLGFKDLLVPAVLIFIPFVFVLKQPDLGTALHIAASSLPIFLVFRLRRHVLITFMALGLILVGLSVYVVSSGSWQILLDKGLIKNHQVERIQTFINPDKDLQKKGWQISQSINAIGSGQLFGRGFMAGTQHKNGFLPEGETDFAFATLAEEWGFVGCMVVLALFLCLLSSSLAMARRSRDRFGSLIALGLTAFLFWQVIINIGMVAGLLPVVGIPLPFISYGGTSLLVTIMAVGLILNVGMRRYLFQDEPVRENPYVWREGPSEEERVMVTVPVRRLAADTPFNPELHPQNRLPHVRPWAKYLRKGRSSLSTWQASASLGGPGRLTRF